MSADWTEDFAFRETREDRLRGHAAMSEDDVARVLAVEDDDLVRDVVTTHLRRAGHQVLAASSGQEALEAIADRAAPDVAVVDIGLPDMDGFALVTAMRERHESLPVIFLSGRVEMEQVDEGRRMGATYLSKPFIASALLTAIDRAVAEQIEHAW